MLMHRLHVIAIKSECLEVGAFKKKIPGDYNIQPSLKETDIKYINFST